MENLNNLFIDFQITLRKSQFAQKWVYYITLRTTVQYNTITFLQCSVIKIIIIKYSFIVDEI